MDLNERKRSGFAVLVSSLRLFSMVASPGHPELFVEKKKMLKKVWSYTMTFVLGSELYLTILHRECYRTIRYTDTNPITLVKWFPLHGMRGHSSYFRCFQKQIERRGRQNKNNRPKVITFSTDFKYTTQS